MDLQKKIIELIENAWKDGNSQYHDCKRDYEYAIDLQNYIGYCEDDILEISALVKAETSKEALNLASINNSEAVVCFRCEEPIKKHKKYNYSYCDKCGANQ